MRRLLIALLFPLTGCAPKVLIATVAPADVQMASAALAPGTGTLKGSALLRQQGGGVVTCAGNEVFLVPATESATRELVRIFGSERGYVNYGGSSSWGGGTLVRPPEPNRVGVCNAQGFFTFDKLRAGKWHAITTVTWSIGSEYQGGFLLATTDVPDGGEAEVVLTY